MRKLVFVFLFTLLIASISMRDFALRKISVSAYSGLVLSAWASSPPVIDGTINAASEWLMADKEDFSIAGSYNGTVYVKNDAANLYLAVKVADDDFGTNVSTRDLFMFHFDNNHNSVGPEIGDDCLSCVSTSIYSDQFFDGSTYQWDGLDGGTYDGVVASSGDGTYNYFELSHPLNSADDAHDFSLTIGDTVGFMMRYADNNTFVGSWPAGASPWTNPTNWHEIKIASSIYQGDLILSDNDVCTITGSFLINGSIIVKENATLILKDAVINFTQTSWDQFNMTFKDPSGGNPRLQVSNATLKSKYSLTVYFYGNSTLDAYKLIAYHLLLFYDESYGNITNSRGLWTVRSYESSHVYFNKSEFIQMQAHDSSVLVFSNSNATNYIEVYGNTKTDVLDSRVRGFGTYSSAQATVSNSTLTYFSDQAWGNTSFANFADTTIGKFRSWGQSHIACTNCSIGFSDIDSRSNIIFEDCWLNGTYVRLSAVVSIRGQCVTNGSILVEENATLILENAVLNFTQTADWQLNMTFRNPADGNPRFYATNAEMTSNFKYAVDMLGNSTALIQNCQFTALSPHYCWLHLWDLSNASFTDFTVRGFSSFTSSGVSFSNSSIEIVNDYVLGDTPLWVYSSSIKTMNTYADAMIDAEESSILAASAFDDSIQRYSDSSINAIHARSETKILLINSTYSDLILDNQSEAFVFWYLDVHVIDVLDNNVPSANVTATYSNATLADSKLTNLDGWARFTLLEKSINATAEYPVGAYTVEATYEANSNDTAVSMTGNKEITLSLDFIVAEFPSVLILSLLMMATLLTVVVYRKRLRPLEQMK